MSEPSKIVCEEVTETYGRFSLEPLEAGLGVTLGNSLRRVLLALLPGAAVTAVKIEGVQHEFSTIPHVREDTTELLLNIKELRLRPLTGRAGKLLLEVKGEGQVTAADISPSADFEVVNPELHLATLDSADAQLSMELDVGLGQGYVPAGHADGLPIGVVPVDAIFTPMRRVNFRVERPQATHDAKYERLVLEVMTDGTVTPVQALAQAAQRLIKEFAPFAEVSRLTLGPTGERPPLPLGISQETYDMAVEQLGLSSRTLNCLRRSGIVKVGELLQKSAQDLMSIRNFGEKSFAEVQEKLAEFGLATAMPEIPKAPEGGRAAGDLEAEQDVEGPEEEVGDAGDVEEKDVQE